MSYKKAVVLAAAVLAIIAATYWRELYNNAKAISHGNASLTSCMQEAKGNCFIAMLPICLDSSEACERATDYCDHLTDADKLYACTKGEFPDKPLPSFTKHWHYSYGGVE